MVPGEYVFTGMAVSGMLATGLGYSITAVVGFLVFCRRDSLLHFEKPVFRGGVLFHASTRGVTGVWLATPAAELLGTAMAAAAVLKYRKRYGY